MQDGLKIGNRVRLKRQAIKDAYIDRRQRGVIVARDYAGLVIAVSFKRVIVDRRLSWSNPVCVTADDVELWQ